MGSGHSTSAPRNVPRSLLPWLVVGLFAICVTALNEVSRLLGAVESAGQQAYDANVFTGFRLAFWNTEVLSAAMVLWRDIQNGTPPFDVIGLLRWHVGVDALLFVATYSAILWKLLRLVGVSNRVALTGAGAVALTDWLETGAT